MLKIFVYVICVNDIDFLFQYQKTGEVAPREVIFIQSRLKKDRSFKNPSYKDLSEKIVSIDKLKK